MKGTTSVCVLAGALALVPAGADAQTAAPVSPNITRICLAPATVEAAPNGVDPMTAVRETFTSFLTGPFAGQPVQLLVEHRQHLVEAALVAPAPVQQPLGDGARGGSRIVDHA